MPRLLLLLGLLTPLQADSAWEALRSRVEQLRAGGDGQIAARHLVARYYASRDYRPAWDDPARLRALRAALEASRDHGLDPADYHTRALDADAGRPSAELELLATDGLVRLAYHLRFGKADPRELYPGWSFNRSLGGVDPLQALDELARSDQLQRRLERYAPQLPAYLQLRQALGRHRAMQKAGGWPVLPEGPTLEPGARDARVAALRERLRLSGDLKAPDVAEPGRFDEALVEAVRRFQSRHGLEQDGRVGRRTTRALNVGVAERIEQIRVNLERLRWVGHEIGNDYLMVDIAGFSAKLVLDGSVRWRSRAVVGRPYRKTPVFRATMESIVLNPPWIVPPTILRQDLLPRLVQDAGYLERNRMQVVDAQGRPVDAGALRWSRYLTRPFPYEVVRAPGKNNPLGRIKFVLPNPYAVYLHDTPARELFRKPERAFSSGCIRLEDPLPLAVLLLDDPARWGPDALLARIETGETQTLAVKRTLPVMLLYFTAEADEEGSVQFRPDLYARDDKVRIELGRPFRFSPVAR